jgi:hypothetical protein
MEGLSTDTGGIMVIAEYIQKAERGEPGASVAQILRDVKAGIVKAEDIHAHYDAQYKPIVFAKLQAFGRGELFACQKEDFQTWMLGKSYGKDFQRYLDLKGEVGMLLPVNRKAASGVFMFCLKRILMPGTATTRAAKEKEHGREAIRQKWLSTNDRFGWNWRHG